MKIFISWSDETSHAIAVALGDWIPSVIQAAETYVSPEDIRKGTRWANDVSKELSRSLLGILCVVPGNVGAPWLNFEAGALSKSLDVSNVIPLLIDVERSELENGPLAQFPSVIYEKNAMYRILETINENTEKGRLSKERLQNTFELWWPNLELYVESIMEKETDEIQQTVQQTDTHEKIPESVVETARRSETKKTQDTGKQEKPVAAKTALDEIEIEILKVLYEPPEYAPKTAVDVGYKLDVSAQRVKEHLIELERKNYVREHLFVGRPTEYSIARKGREYLTMHDPSKKRQEK